MTAEPRLTSRPKAAASSLPKPKRGTPRPRKPDRSATGDPSARLHSLLDFVVEAVVACDRDGRIQTWNRGASRIFGRDAEEVIGWSLDTLFASPQRQVVMTLARAALGGDPVDLFRTEGSRRDGSNVHLSVTLSPMLDDQGDVAGLCMVARDVTALRVVEDQAARDHAMLAQREASLRDALAALRTSHEQLKTTQLQLVRAAKLESVGRLAAGVAHEVKNPLAIILAGTDVLLGQPSTPKDTQAVLRDIRAAVLRANTVVAGLLNYSASNEIKPTAASINDVIRQSVQLVSYALSRGHVEVVEDLADDLPQVSLDVGRIEQVIVNLLMNALDAMPKGGTLTIRTRRTQLTAADRGAGYRRTDDFRVGQTVIRVDIEDSGTGIPDEQMAKVFEPFYTTKPTGKGTGLGLAVCRTIVAMHGGSIWIGNRPEGGAVATLVLRSMIT